MKMHFQIKYGKFPNFPASVNKIVWPAESASWYLAPGRSFLYVLFLNDY